VFFFQKQNFFSIISLLN